MLKADWQDQRKGLIRGSKASKVVFSSLHFYFEQRFVKFLPFDRGWPASDVNWKQHAVVQFFRFFYTLNEPFFFFAERLRDFESSLLRFY